MADRVQTRPLGTVLSRGSATCHPVLMSVTAPTNKNELQRGGIQLLVAIVALMCALSLALGLAPAAARGQGVDQTCALTLTKTDPATVNVAYPDDSAIYYSGAYQLAPGTHIRIHGRFPHARYMSFNVYDAVQRPLDGVSDGDAG